MTRHNLLRHALRQSCYLLFALTVSTSATYSSGYAASDTESLVEAQREFERGDLRAALRHSRRAARDFPDSIEAQQWLGYIAAIMGEAEEALAAYRRVATLKPSALSSYWLGRFAGDIGETTVAVEALQQSLGYSGQDGNVEFTPGQRRAVAEYLFRMFFETRERERALSFARAQGWISEGVDFCTRPASLPISPKTAALLALLIHPKTADCALQVGKDLTENADYRLARLVLVALIQNSGTQQVREDAEAFVRHRLPSHDIAKRSEWLHDVGNALNSRFRSPDEAIAVYRKAIDADSKFAQPYYRIGYTYWRKGSHDDAINWLNKALSVQPTHWRATYGLACVLLDQKKYEEASSYYRRAVELNPNDADSFYHIGYILSHLKKYDQALPAYQKAVALEPDSAYSRWGLSWVLRKLGREDEAKIEWANAVKLDPALANKNRQSETNR